MLEFNVLEIMTGDGTEIFNYFFTLVMVFGWVAFGIGLLFKIINRS